MKFPIDRETLKRQIAADPDIETEAGVLHPEAPVLKKQVRPFEKTLCAFTVIKRRFWPSN